MGRPLGVASSWRTMWVMSGLTKGWVARKRSAQGRKRVRLTSAGGAAGEASGEEGAAGEEGEESRATKSPGTVAWAQIEGK